MHPCLDVTRCAVEHLIWYLDSLDGEQGEDEPEDAGEQAESDPAFFNAVYHEDDGEQHQDDEHDV